MRIPNFSIGCKICHVEFLCVRTSAKDLGVGWPKVGGLVFLGVGVGGGGGSLPFYAFSLTTCKYTWSPFQRLFLPP